MLNLGEGVKAVLEAIDTIGKDVADRGGALKERKELCQRDEIVRSSGAVLVDVIAEAGDVILVEKKSCIEWPAVEVRTFRPIHACSTSSFLKLYVHASFSRSASGDRMGAKWW